MTIRPEFLPFCVPSIGEAEIREVVDTLKSGWITTGPRVRAFEKAFSSYQGVGSPLALSSATAALHIALHALDLAPDDEVITPSLSWVSAANMVEMVGAKPIFCDIEYHTLQPCLKDIATKITDQTRAIIPVHFAGQPYDIDGLSALTRGRDITIIEDAAHAVGTRYKGRMVGRDGHFSVFSFHPIKNITTGEGGLLACNDHALFERLRLLRFHGIAKDSWERYNASGEFGYDVVEPGFKYNMMDIQAAIGLKQLEKVESLIEQREILATRYDRMLGGLRYLEGQGAPEYPFRHARHLYTVKLDSEATGLTRNELMSLLRKRNIGSGLHFAPVHLQAHYRRKYGYSRGDLPNTEMAGDRILSLPLFPGMTESDQDHVVASIEAAVAERK
ncbi:DegT/DnrJ/EryC1/StrS family aminotransferase [Rhodothermus sp. AH-315-K08]|nr:DegT/DnrJ/EryC1/StrS family aminotransferase [Rhodothermus sp. AH-315-K08]